MIDPVTDARAAFDERHPLRDALLGLGAVCAPLLARVRRGDTTALPDGEGDPLLVDVCLGILALAWRVEGVLLAAAAEAPPVAPPRGPTLGGIAR